MCTTLVMESIIRSGNYTHCRWVSLNPKKQNHVYKNIGTSTFEYNVRINIYSEEFKLVLISNCHCSDLAKPTCQLDIEQTCPPEWAHVQYQITHYLLCV